MAILFDIFNAFQIRKQYLSSNVLKKVLLHVASFMYLNLYEMCLKKQADKYSTNSVARKSGSGSF